jgi:uroporphyrinogen decarboxylase
VTEESRITRALKEMVLREKPDTTDPKAWNLEFTSFIHDRADLEKFPWKAAEDVDFSKVHSVKQFLPDKMKVIAISGKIFTLTWMLMGFNNFALKLAEGDPLVSEVVERVATIQHKLLERIFELDYVAGVWAVDDLAFGTGPMISPKAFREYIFPWYRTVADKCHDHNRIFLMHSDGDVSVLMEDLIAMGLDVLQPVDPTCMDIVEVKKKYGERICIIGNVPNELLRSGSTDEIEALVKQLLRQVAPGGSYCLGSGNSVPDWARFENYMAMREATLKYGAYPIRVD